MRPLLYPLKEGPCVLGHKLEKPRSLEQSGDYIQQTSVARIPHNIRRLQFQEPSEGCLAVYGQRCFVMHMHTYIEV
jgi:hypothetical protein